MDLFHVHTSDVIASMAFRQVSRGMLSEGDCVKEFEKNLASMGLCNPVTVNSGTSALHLALVTAGVGPGDNVILPPQTFVATGMAVLHCGANPVFVDIDPMTGNISLESLASMSRMNVAAVIPVHWTGLPCDLDEMKWKSVIIEDAAHAFGATYKGRLIGSGGMSDFTCFSFQALKHVTTGDGGCICCDSPTHVEEMIRRRWFGIPRNHPPGFLGEREFILTDIGFKYHLNDVSASIGIGSLMNASIRLARRQEIGKRYREALAGVKDVVLLDLPVNVSHAYWVFAMRVKRRHEFVGTMRERGIPCSVINRRIDRHPIFGGMRDLPGQAEFEAEQINIPCHEGLTDGDVNNVINAIQEGW